MEKLILNQIPNQYHQRQLKHFLLHNLSIFQLDFFFERSLSKNALPLVYSCAMLIIWSEYV